MHGRTSKVTVLSLGANTGCREDSILRACHRLCSVEGLIMTALSSLYESEPEGAGFTGPFVNAAALFQTVLEPGRLLEICKEIERSFGRRTGEAHRDRPIDIDIVLMGDLLLDEPDLMLPHPRFRYRRFVVEPLAEIAPDLAVPPDGASAREILDHVPRKSWIRKISSRGQRPHALLTIGKYDRY